jgi:nucleotide-binding universal stress UspA family protein
MKLLVLADDSEPALRAVRHATQLFEERRISELVLLNIQPPLPQGRSCAFHCQAEFRRKEEADGEAALRPACKILDAAGVHYVKQVKIGETAPTIAQVAADDCQGIVMAKFSRWTINTWSPWRLARKLRSLTRVPVTLVA